MANLITLKYLSLFALTLTLLAGVSSQASEVTGHLSSTMSANVPTTNGSLDGTVVSPTVAVAPESDTNSNRGGSGGGSSSGGGGGQVLGANTEAATNSYQMNIFSNDGTALQAPARSYISGSDGDFTELALADETLAQAPVLDQGDKPLGQVAIVSSAFGGISLGSWIWIILLLALLAAFVAYNYYAHSENRDRLRRP